jgi:hypothetical protein
VSLQRGNEIIDLSGDTQVQILDRAGRSQFTTVKQHFGTVAVEADVRQVQHFSVETPHLAAVVKGTKFTVVSGTDTAKVSVQRGHVAVEDADTHQTTLLSVGQSASTGDGGVPLAVSERGTMPVIYSTNGKPAGGSKEVGGPSHRRRLRPPLQLRVTRAWLPAPAAMGLITVVRGETPAMPGLPE